MPVRTPVVLLTFLAMAMATAPGSVQAGSLMHCSYDDGRNHAEAEGDVAVCGPCLLGGGACASAFDLPIRAVVRP